MTEILILVLKYGRKSDMKWIIGAVCTAAVIIAAGIFTVEVAVTIAGQYQTD